MPTKRTRRSRHLSSASTSMTTLQRDHLEGGFTHINDEQMFEDDAHRRAVWVRHRDLIMKEWTRHDTYPPAFWEYERPWPAGAVSEQHAIHLLPDTSAERRARIEADWLRRIEINFHQFTATCWAREAALEIMPSAFWDQHAPAIEARLAAQMAEHRALVGVGMGS
jgi:hypothetical protein